MKRKTELFFSIQNADAEKRLVSGVSESGEPNQAGLLLDYATSKPQLIAWSENIAKKTKGASKGVLRVMHQLETVGKIVEIGFDDDRRHILVTVHVSDDKTWEKIQSGEYTGFSWWWRTVGMPWKDDEATKQYGRPIHSYTGKPIELSIVDAPCVPGSDFTSIQNADFIEEDDMDELTAATGTDIKNGIYTAGKLGEILGSLSWTQKAIAAEESKEGDSAAIPDELKGIVSDLAAVWSKYSTAQAQEFAKGEDVDMFVSDDDDFADLEDVRNADSVDIENGDYPGHPFHGNQHTGGKGGRAGAHHQASKSAHRASVRAHSEQSVGAHKAALKAHKAAAAMHAAKGNKRMEAYHKAQASHHSSLAKVMSGDTKNADAPDVQNAAKPDAFAALEARLAALEVKNAEAKPAETNADILAALAAAAAPAADIQNADKPDATTVVSKDEDNGVGQDVQNAEAYRVKEATRIASMPEAERAAAIAAKIFQRAAL